MGGVENSHLPLTKPVAVNTQGWRYRAARDNTIYLRPLTPYNMPCYTHPQKDDRIVAIDSVTSRHPMYSQSNGKGHMSTPCGSKTPERISMKPRIYKHVAGLTTHTRYKSMWRCDNVIYDVFLCKDVPIGVTLLPLPIYGIKFIKNPYLGEIGGVNRLFQA